MSTRGRAELVDTVTLPARRALYLESGWWDGTTLPQRVREHASSAGDRVAVVDEASGAHTYAQLAADAASVAIAFAERGVEPGSVVSVQLPNRYETVVCGLAALSLGAVVNPLLPNYRLHELSHVFRTVQPAVVCTPHEYRGFDHVALIDALVAETGVRPAHVVVGGTADAIAGSGDRVAFESLLGRPGELGVGREASAVSEVIFTSGTEAQPKAIMHTEQTANFSVRVAFTDLGMDDADVVWMPSPIGHSTGFNYGVRFALYHGLRLVLQDKWDGAVAAALVAEHRCSYTLAATTFLQDLIAAASVAGSRLDTLRFFGCGGAPVPAHLVDLAAAHGVQVLRLYGSTEVLVGSWNRPWSTPEQKRNTDGLPMSHVEMEIRDGELWTRGPNTCVGFYADPARTADTFDTEGWVRSGDLLTIDADGYATVVGRKKEIIIRGGLNIAPREIEELIVAFPEVERVAIVGLPDARLGETMCACVVLVPGASLDFDDMVARLRSGGLATYKLPQRLEILDGLPMTASGKIQKHEIVKALGA